MQEEVEGFVDALLPGAVRLSAAAADAVLSALQALQAGKHVFMEVSRFVVAMGSVCLVSCCCSCKVTTPCCCLRLQPPKPWPMIDMQTLLMCVFRGVADRRADSLAYQGSVKSLRAVWTTGHADSCVPC